MSISDLSRSTRQEKAARYRIRVHGHLDASWSDRLGDMVITRAYSKQKEPMTILVGALVDQSALSGVLNILHDLNLRLLSVENIDEHKDCT